MLIEGKTYKGRVYKRKFDHDEARFLHSRGASLRDLAEKYGVSQARINQVVNPEVGRRAEERSSAYRWACPECGAPTQGKRKRCRPCANKLRATSVRAEELQCFRCQQWKPDESYPSNRQEPVRRGRHGLCRVCQTEVKREYRKRNPEKTRAYEREYRRRKRLAQKLA